MHLHHVHVSQCPMATPMGVAGPGTMRSPKVEGEGRKREPGY